MIKKAGFGGGCHWCTEAVFSSVKGVKQVQQGWIASDEGNAWLSEAVIVDYDDALVAFDVLIAIHLYTHSSTALHSMRNRYRSAVYVFNPDDAKAARHAIGELQNDFEKPLVTQVLPFKRFEPSRDELLGYYYSNPQKPFCENYINPKLKLILQKFSEVADSDKLRHL